MYLTVNSNSAIELAARLIRIPSVTDNESEVLDFIEAWLGEQREVQNIERTSMFVAGRRAGADSSRALLLSGHIDTVTAGPHQLWRHDPFGAEIEQGVMYGRGASDMKAGLAAMMAAFRSINTPSCDVWLVATAREERDGAGSAAFVKYFLQHTSYREVSCVIAEPTDMERIEIGHRGNRFVQLVFHGEAQHASQQKAFTVSGIGKAALFLQDIPALFEELQCYKNHFLGFPSLVPTIVSAGDADSPNRTSDEARLTLDIRTTPEFDADFEIWIGSMADRYHFSWQYVADPAQSALCSMEAPVIKGLRRAGAPSVTAASPAATDQTFFEEAGISTAVFGPGVFSQAHTKDECVPVKNIELAEEIFQRLIAHF